MLDKLLARFKKPTPEVWDVFPILVRYEDESEDTVVLKREDLKDMGFRVIQTHFRGNS